MAKSKPNYNRIYSDIINLKYPEKRENCKNLLGKSNLSVMDILKLNSDIFYSQDKSAEKLSQKYRSYTEDDIAMILSYQQKNRLNDSQLARHFKMSRNTVAKWKKIFSSDSF